MKTLTLELFKEYVASRGDDDIVHGYWKNCAIGQFLETQGISVLQDIGYIQDLVPEIHKVAVGGFVDLLESIDILDLLNHSHYDTYSELLGDL